MRFRKPLTEERRRDRRHRRLTVAAALGLAAVVAGIVWSDQQERKPAAGAKPRPSATSAKASGSQTTATPGDAAATPAVTRPPPAAEPGAPFPPPASTARSMLAALTVTGNKNSGSYARDAFGPGWSGTGSLPKLADGCTARDQVLKRDLHPVKVGDINPCIVFSGTLADPYTGRQHEFSRYAKSAIELDHVVALGAAWRSGAWAWTPEQRQRFANDIDNLLAVDKQANQDKSSKTPDQWMPPNHFAACPYAQRWVGVKARYGLSVTPAEHDALVRILAGCA